MKIWIMTAVFALVAAVCIPAGSAQAATEGFETGNFSSLPWVTGGNGAWSVKNTTARTGVYSAEAPVSITDNQSSYLEVTLDCTDGNITFWYSVSSEANYDFLNFYIDGVLQKRWSGSLAWAQASFPVTAGRHTLRWVYSKDYSLSRGLDTAWIDDIVVPLVSAPPAGSLIEDFETGDLTKFPWSRTGSGQWLVTNATSQSGTYSARSPLALPDGTSASLEVTLECTEGAVSFWYAASTEANKDFLLFYIDGTLYNQWSGARAWGQSQSYPVSAGRHTFKWIYAKDYIGSSGADAVWIDNIAFPAPPASGSLDTTFGSGGKTTTTFGSYDMARAVALQPDGKIVAAGFAYSSITKSDFSLVRHLPNGTLDASFGSGGKVTTDFSTGRSDYAYAMALQNDGRIVVAGSSSTSVASSQDFALARYNANGTLDVTFGTGGKVLTAVGSSADEAYAVAVQGDGKIVAAGYALNGGSNDFALARYNANGTLDTGFGKSGKTVLDFGGSDYIFDIVLQKDGKIVAAGYTTAGGLALARFNTDGTPDMGFGTLGKVIRSEVSTGRSIALQQDGKLVVGGSYERFKPDATVDVDFAVTRFNTDGSLDATFGNGGSVVTDFGSYSDSGYDVVIQSDGRIIVVGEVLNPAGNTNTDFALVRYNTNGSLDTTFGAGGKVLSPLSASGDGAFSAALQLDGKIVAAGRFYADVYATPVFVVARFWP